MGCGMGRGVGRGIRCIGVRVIDRGRMRGVRAVDLAARVAIGVRGVVGAGRVLERRRGVWSSLGERGRGEGAGEGKRGWGGWRVDLAQSSLQPHLLSMETLQISCMSPPASVPLGLRGVWSSLWQTIRSTGGQGGLWTVVPSWWHNRTENRLKLWRILELL